MDKGMKECYTVYMEKELYEKSKKIAKEKGISPSKLLSGFIEDGLIHKNDVLSKIQKMTIQELSDLIKQGIEIKKKPVEDDSTGQP
jgi:hypothetical protein